MNKLVEILTGIPQEIKTLEVDTEKKIFKLNGIDFGKGCEEFVISCTGGEGFKIRMELSKRIIYAYQNFMEMYEAYHALGGNGMVTKMKNEIEELHLKQKERI